MLKRAALSEIGFGFSVEKLSRVPPDEWRGALQEPIQKKNDRRRVTDGGVNPRGN